MSMADYEDGLKQAYEQPGAIADYEAALPESSPEPVPLAEKRGLFLNPENGEYFLTFGTLAEEIRGNLGGLIEVTGDETHERECAKQEAIAKLIYLDSIKPEITAYYEDLKQTLAEVAKFVPMNGYFKGPDGTVFKLVKPLGQFVHFKDLDYERTKREGEARGSLSMKEAKDAAANNFQPLPEE